MADATYRTVTPYLVVDDADAVMKFMTAAFGAVEKSCDRRPDGAVGHAEMTIGDSLIMLGQAGGPWKAKTGAFYLWIDDVDGAYERALRAGGTSESKPEESRTATATPASTWPASGGGWRRRSNHVEHVLPRRP